MIFCTCPVYFPKHDEKLWQRKNKNCTTTSAWFQTIKPGNGNKYIQTEQVEFFPNLVLFHDAKLLSRVVRRNRPSIAEAGGAHAWALSETLPVGIATGEIRAYLPVSSDEGMAAGSGTSLSPRLLKIELNKTWAIFFTNSYNKWA